MQKWANVKQSCASNAGRIYQSSMTLRLISGSFYIVGTILLLTILDSLRNSEANGVHILRYLAITCRGTGWLL